MLLGQKSWNDAGHAGVVLMLAVLTLTVVSGCAHNDRKVSLGSKELCVSYSGLPDNWLSDTHAGMRYLEGGEFILGTTLGYEEERQEVKTSVRGFWIDQTEVTVAQFATFVKATGYVTEGEREGGGLVFSQPDAAELRQRPYSWWRYVKGANWRQPSGQSSSAAPNQPVTLITLEDAKAYAEWLGRDLPTEAEWEYAAKAGYSGAELEKEPRDASGQPRANYWQGTFPTQNITEDGYAGLAPVGCYSANEFNLYDMIGNAWEQTRDIYSESHQMNSNSHGSEHDLKPDRLMVIKGGSHLCGRDFCVRYRPSAREGHEANLPISHIGFRTVSRRNDSVAALPVLKQ
ncbi:formylglycine-generating enzyme family protein [Methylicorpusculum oleiharenae]|uniref:SUMF1/EgtB/PvdO family nonheme iron enzyme n=1 Tax=Methylicorpusculum oleiharenae TaxID=1338687 RepID=UPI00135A7141|nr:SUMF1/EgtB/PvdO family nonheme iron enzyme [Methylicorpusculum oleiharenae]MCD2450481.1 formylglycine-generating enzyme family protein [Methylicorpusculum oleiharenae]